MGNIHVLSFEVANLIAAGEVVERPSSVLKELIENSIDSGATKIVAEIKRGGIALIRVTDNGCGMTRDDLPVALKRHATSKIRDEHDLAAIMTLGFRGEALAAISSVSRMMIITKTKDAEVGSMLTATAGQVDVLSDVECADGTTVTVEDLFFNVPARRKFLKKESTEAMNVAALVEKVALSRPDISIQLLVDGEERFKTPGGGDRERTAYAVLGRDFAEKTIPVDGTTGGIHVYGLIGRSDNVRKNRNLENIFINGRYVKSLTAAAALEKAYTSYIAPESFPACVLFLDMDPMSVDVNVHPAKLEVKFSDERAVFEAVYYTVRHALESSEYRPEFALGKKADTKNFVPPAPAEQIKFAPSGAHADRPPVSDRPTVPAPSSFYGTKPTVPPSAAARVESGKPSFSYSERRETLTPRESLRVLDAYRKAEPEEKTPAPMPAPTDVAGKTAPEYHYVGEAFDCYVMIEYRGDLLIIDKHAAHERVIFEELKARQAEDGRVSSQTLLLPLAVSLTADEYAAVTDFSEELRAVGFDFDLGERVVNIKAIPERIDLSDAEGLFVQMADELAGGRGNPAVTESNRRERTLYQVACKAAIKGGRVYDRSVIDWLIGKILSLPDITVCPHGRPIAYKITKHELDKQFDRIK